MMNVYTKIEEMGIKFSEVVPGGIYNTVLEFGDNLCYTSGHNCKVNGVLLTPGKLGAEVTLEEGKDAARQCIINILSSLHNELGDLNRIKKVVKILGFVASTNDFYNQPKVLDAASQMLIDIFGDAGKAARSAVGVNVLPNNQPVEIELLLELN